MEYNYREALKEDILQAIAEKEQWIGKAITEVYEDKDEAYDQLYDDLWIDDSVTGNASGSYYCNTYKAEEALCHNWDILDEALREFGCSDENITEKGAEWCDVTIRCYLLGEVLGQVLEEMFEQAD